MAVPAPLTLSPLTYGSITGWYSYSTADTNADANKFPDVYPDAGTITFTPTMEPRSLKVTTSTPQATDIAVEPVTITLDANGFVPETWLIANDNPRTTPTAWQWVVTYNLEHNKVPSHNISVPTNGSVNLNLAAPIAVSKGVYITKGDPGEPGPSGDGETLVTQVNGKIGNVVLTADDIADTASKVLMTGTERSRLSQMQDGATQNSTDAFLRDRGNHTGAQTSATISDFTEAVQDAVAALLSAGTGVTLTYNDAGNSLTITGTAGSGGTLDAEAVRDAIGIALIGSGLIAVTVNDAADTITITTTATANSTDAQLRARSTHTGTQTASTISDFDAAVDARVTAMLAAYGVKPTVWYNGTAWPATRTVPAGYTGGWIIADSEPYPNVTAPAFLITGDRWNREKPTT